LARGTSASVGSVTPGLLTFCATCNSFFNTIYRR
jgi:hypothetical protein